MPHDVELAFSREAIVGWRVWRVARPVERPTAAAALAAGLLASERRGEADALEELFLHRLRSLTEQTFWPGGRPFRAGCRTEPAGVHAAPGIDCECGLWAFRDRGAAERTAAAYAHCGGPVVYGRVALWGRVVEHEHGWRGELARPLELLLCGAGLEIACELLDAYEGPVELVEWPDAHPEPLAEAR